MSTAVKKVDENKFEVILDRIVQLEETGVQFPANYSPENAARSAWLILQDTKDRSGKPALEVCKPVTVANAMLKMVSMGLNPIKKQCYFIVYGDELQCQPSYQGNIATAKRFGLKNIPANIIHQGDEFEYTITPEGFTKITKHIQSFNNLSKPIIGAYAVANMEDGTSDTTIMTMEDIQNSWQQGATKGNSPAHKNFDGEMSKKTVINRACKTIINSSDDAALFDDDTSRVSPTQAHVNHQIKENANKKELTFDDDTEEAEGIEVKEPEEVKANTKADAMPEMQFD